jgi:hypothetical protein
VHPHGQSGFLCIERLGSSDVLPACPRRCSPSVRRQSA